MNSVEDGTDLNAWHLKYEEEELVAAAAAAVIVEKQKSAEMNSIMSINTNDVCNFNFVHYFLWFKLVSYIIWAYLETVYWGYSFSS
jgi:hypothetical protein